jgi:hypothetical protein
LQPHPTPLNVNKNRYIDEAGFYRLIIRHITIRRFNNYTHCPSPEPAGRRILLHYLKCQWTLAAGMTITKFIRVLTQLMTWLCTDVLLLPVGAVAHNLWEYYV